MAVWMLLLASVSADAVKVDFDYPAFVALGPEKTLYVADKNAPAIFKITASGQVTTLVKGSREYRTPLYHPRGLALAKTGDLWVCDPATYDILRITPKGEIVPVTGKKTKLLTGKEGTIGTTVVQPEGLAIGGDGSVFVTDMKLRAIFKFTADGKAAKFADVTAPRGLAVDKDGSLVVVSNSSAQLLRVGADGKVTPIIEGRPFQFPMSVCVRPDGTYAVTDNYSKAIWSVTREGKVDKLVEGAPLVNPTGIACDEAGNLAIADSHAKKVFWLSPDKKLTVAAEAK